MTVKSIFVCLMLSSSVCAQSDESGTLAVLARSSNSVIVSIDSMITHNLPHPDYLAGQSVSFNQPERKLVDVGHHSACAIVGYSGIQDSRDYDIAAQLREWVTANLDKEATTNMQPLLEITAAAWDARHYRLEKDLPAGRKINDLITTLLCGSFVNHEALISRGRTVVANDLHARAESIPSYEGDILYVEGAMNTPFLLNIVTGFTPSPVSEGNAADDTQYLSKQIASNPKAAAALKSWQEQIIAANGSRTLREPDGRFKVSWTEVQIRDLLLMLYKSFEYLYPSKVGPPNNVRVFRESTNFSGTVEDTRWSVVTKKPR